MLVLKGLTVQFSGPGGGPVHRFPVAIARGKHLFPFRTEQLSPSAPMVLGSQGPGRVGRRRFFLFEGLPAGGPRPFPGGLSVDRKATDVVTRVDTIGPMDEKHPQSPRTQPQGTAAGPLTSVFPWLAAQRSFTVVQIGAHVGNTPNDPIYSFLRKELPSHPASVVVLVEPVAEFFRKLQQAYGDLPSVRLENVAVAEEEGKRDFYRLGVDPADYGRPEWLSQLGSLRAERLERLWDNYERTIPNAAPHKQFQLEHRVRETVQCTTFHRLLDRHGITDLDLLQIDAEGYDYEILRTIDFDRVRPRFINYERVLLQDDEPACRAMLSAAGYVLFNWSQNTLCVAVASD
jgi:FkbM family methyltransferase